MIPVDKQLAFIQIVNEAKSLASGIKNTRSPDTAQFLLSQLSALINDPIARSSQLLYNIISELITTGTAEMNQVIEAANAEQSAASSLSHNIAHEALVASNERLSEYLDTQDIWLEGDKEYFESLKANEGIFTFDENGNLRTDAAGNAKSTETDGERVKESVLIMNAFGNQDKLTQQAREELNFKLYGNKDGPQNEEQRKAGIKRLHQANADVEGLAARDGNEKNATQRYNESRKKIDALDKAQDEVEATKDNPELHAEKKQEEKARKEEVEEDFGKKPKAHREDRIQRGTQPGASKQATASTPETTNGLGTTKSENKFAHTSSFLKYSQNTLVNSAPIDSWSPERDSPTENLNTSPLASAPTQSNTATPEAKDNNTMRFEVVDINSALAAQSSFKPKSIPYTQGNNTRYIS